MIADKVNTFTRGASFEGRFSLPELVAPTFFNGWTATSQIRKAGVVTDAGYIADLELQWVDQGVSREFILLNDDTAEWPLGAAELDVLFVHPESGRKIRTKKYEVTITYGVTEV